MSPLQPSYIFQMGSTWAWLAAWMIEAITLSHIEIEAYNLISCAFVLQYTKYAFRSCKPCRIFQYHMPRKTTGTRIPPPATSLLGVIMSKYQMKHNEAYGNQGANKYTSKHLKWTMYKYWLHRVSSILKPVSLFRSKPPIMTKVGPNIIIQRILMESNHHSQQFICWNALSNSEQKIHDLLFYSDKIFDCACISWHEYIFKAEKRPFLVS